MAIALISALSLGLLFQPQPLAQPAPATTVAPVDVVGEPASPVATDSSAQSEMVCRTRPRLGSRIQVRICMSAAEALAQEEASRAYLESMQRTSTDPNSPVRIPSASN